jgi:methyltransferase family protein
MVGATRFIRRIANAAGFDIHRYSGAEWRWSYNIDSYYPVDPLPRWGYGKPPHPQINKTLDQSRADISARLSQFRKIDKVINLIPRETNADSETPSWCNIWFGYFDAFALVATLASTGPRRYLEIGSGNSTKLARFVIKNWKLLTSITSLDPEPRATIDNLCDKVIRERLENSDLSIFDELESGDILFFDGSHRTFTNSDVTVFFLEVMPKLRSGVLVHIHDIFLPWDYPPEWGRRMYSEQYILASMLLCPEFNFRILLPNFFVCQDLELSFEAKALMEPLACNAIGSSFWIEKR